MTTVISVENISKPYRLGAVSRKASRTVSRGTLAHDLTLRLRSERATRSAVFLNGATLRVGMSRVEIQRKFDETCPELGEGL